MKSTFGDGSTIIAKLYSFGKPHRVPQTTCAQKTLILYTASGYIDQQTKKFIRRGRDTCLQELKEIHGINIS